MQSGSVETGLQLFSRLSNRLSVLFLDTNLFPSQLKNGETVEISGNMSSGKTFLITKLLANCILPSKTTDLVPIGGQNAAAILIDANHHFRMPVIVKIIRNTIVESYKSLNQIPSEELIKGTIKSALENLTVINCYDRLQFRLSVLSLEDMLLQNEKIALLVIDGIVAFYWEDRDRDNIWLKDLYLKYILNLVQKYTTLLHKVTLIYTISNDFMPKEKDYSTWSSIKNTDHRINLTRTDSNEFYGMVRSRNCKERTFRYEITESGLTWI